MLDPSIFPELNSSQVQDWVLKIIEGYSFIERVLLYHDMKGQGSYILVYVIPDKETLIRTEDPSYQAFNSFESAFTRSVDLDEAFPRTAHDSKRLCNEVEADSDKDERLRSSIVIGSSHWVMYEKYPPNDGIVEEQSNQIPKRKASAAKQRFERDLLAFAKRKLKKNRTLSVPDIARQALMGKENFLYYGRPRDNPLKLATIEKSLRELLKQQK